MSWRRVYPSQELLSTPRADIPVRARRLGVWVVIAILLALTGVTCTVVAARALARSDAERSRQAFTQASNQVAATVRLALAREQDLVVSAGTFALGSPHASNPGFKRWVHEENAFVRYPELEGIATIALVPRAGLPAFAALVAAGASAPQRGPFAILPAGIRPYYCFVSLSQGRHGSDRVPTGVDFCAANPQLIGSRSTGLGYDFGIRIPTLSRTPLLGIETPLYRGGGAPATADERRRDFVGWTAIVVFPRVLLTGAIEGHPGMAVELRDTSGPGLLAFTAGQPAHGAATMRINLHDGSTVETYAAISGAGLSGDANSRALLTGGSLLSAVLLLLALVLITGRWRALRLVVEKTEQLSYQAMHDALTTLPNRALVIDRAELMLARARRLDIPIATMFIDVDGFKHVNDTFGHGAGDQFLQIIAERLSGAIRETDTVGRLGGDEFVVLVEGETLFAGVEFVAERLLSVLRQPLELDGALGRPQSCSVSIGVAVGQRASADQLLHDADLAMYQAKEAGKNRYVLFEERMQTDSVDRLELEADLGDALAEEQLFLLYQPTFDLQSEVATGVEALVRWAHPTRGVVAPDVFIPLAEENAMIIPLGRWVLQQACRQGALWHAAGYTIGMAVNVSARQLEHDGFIEDVRDALAAHDLPPAALTLEITETVLMRDATAAAVRLRALKALGVRIAIDDFGTGYSSLAYLRQFPVDALKIDRSFMSGIASSHEAEALMHTLIQLGKALGLETLGEGIEEHAQLEQLRHEDCDSGQGFFFARPLEAEAVTRFLDRKPVQA
jgi:diguanylate cyclase (GGDEF)-like protein